jgi:ribonucleoside-triphosphate reductase
MSRLKSKYGEIPGVTDREFLTNSHHCGVWEDLTIQKKLEIEAPFTRYATGGCITYIEVDSGIIQNLKAVEKIIDMAMDMDIPYFGINFPLDCCADCGYQGEIEESCPSCKSENIERLRRVTGYLSTDYRNFNRGKQAEVIARTKHGTNL